MHALIQESLYMTLRPLQYELGKIEFPLKSH